MSEQKTPTTMSKTAFYDSIQDPISAVKEMAVWIYTSGMFKLPGGRQGEGMAHVIAWFLMSERMSPLLFRRLYHVFPNGEISMQASAMYAGLVKLGWEATGIVKTPDRVSITVERGKTRNKESYTYELTWEECQQEAWPWRDKRDKAKGIKDNWSTPIGRQSMMWARLVSDVCRTHAPEINAGVYTEQEIVDFSPETAAELDQIANDFVAATSVEAVEAETAPKAEVPATESNGKPKPKAKRTRKKSTAKKSKPSAEKPDPKPEEQATEDTAATSEKKVSDEENGNAQPAQLQEIRSLVKDKLGWSGADWKGWIANEFSVESASQLSRMQAYNCVMKLREIAESQPEKKPEKEEKPLDLEVDTTASSATTAKITKEQVTEIGALKKEHGFDVKGLVKELFGAGSAKELNKDQADQLIANLMRKATAGENRSEMDEWAQSALAG